MSKILDLQKRAHSAQEKHLKDIDEKLSSDISAMLSDTERTLIKKAQSLEASILGTQQNITQLQLQTTETILQQMDSDQESIQEMQADATVAIKEKINSDQKDIILNQSRVTEVIKQNQNEVQAELQASLAKFNYLSAETVKHMTIKNMLFKSNIVLISVICIAVIVIILQSMLITSKYNEIKLVEKNLQLTQEKEWQVNSLLEMTEKEFYTKYPHLEKSEKSEK